MDENLIWKDVVGYAGLYSVSYCGVIYSHPRFGANGRILKPFDSFGYPRVGLTKGNKTKTLKVHRLVAIAHKPNPLNLPFVNHLDGRKSNPHGDNLEWTTAKGNIRHAWRLGLSKVLKGEANGSSKLTDEQRFLIVQDYATTSLTQIEIAKKYGVTQANVPLVIKAFLKELFEKGEAIENQSPH